MVKTQRAGRALSPLHEWFCSPPVTGTDEDAKAWGPMLVQYVQVVFPDAVDDPDPPELIALISIPSVVFLPFVLR